FVEVAPVVLVEPGLNFTGRLSGSQAPYARREPDLEVVVGTAASRRHLDKAAGDIAGSARREIAPERLGLEPVDGVPVTQRHIGQRYRGGSGVDQIEVRLDLIVACAGIR